MRVLVTGGRSYSNRNRVAEELRKLEPTEVICGGAPGADFLAHSWALRADVKRTAVFANWRKHGKAAGPMRNQKMVDMKPDVVLAFPGGRGTADCVRRARAAGIPIITIHPKE